MPASPVRGPRLSVFLMPAPPAGAVRWLCGAMLAAAALVCAQPAQADLARIRQAGTLKVAVYKACRRSPRSRGSQVGGHDVALARALGKELGLSVALMPFDATKAWLTTCVPWSGAAITLATDQPT